MSIDYCHLLVNCTETQLSFVSAYPFQVSDLRSAAMEQTSPPKGLLLRVEPVSELDDGMDDGTKVQVTGYKREAIEELESMFRQVSQYPVHAAPPPEQLLAQLFKKPNLL